MLQATDQGASFTAANVAAQVIPRGCGSGCRYRCGPNQHAVIQLACLLTAILKSQAALSDHYGLRRHVSSRGLL
jgi:hypothetical protein